MVVIATALHKTATIGAVPTDSGGASIHNRSRWWPGAPPDSQPRKPPRLGATPGGSAFGIFVIPLPGNRYPLSTAERGWRKVKRPDVLSRPFSPP